jgi:hypothetical protein
MEEKTAFVSSRRTLKTKETEFCIQPNFGPEVCQLDQAVMHLPCILISAEILTKYFVSVSVKVLS